MREPYTGGMPVQAAFSGVVLLPVRWEINASAEMGAPAQDVINRQIVDDSDVLLGNVLDPPRHADWDSRERHCGGTKPLPRRGKAAALYVARIPADPFTVDQEQMAALKQFLDGQRANGLVGEFQSPEELVAQVTDTLTRFVRSVSRAHPPSRHPRQQNPSRRPTFALSTTALAPTTAS